MNMVTSGPSAAVWLPRRWGKILNRPAADAAAPVEVDKDDEEGVEVEENDYEDDGGRGR